MSSDPPHSSVQPISAEELLGAARKLANDLMRSKALERGDLESAMTQLTETAARALRIERVSVWLFDSKRDLVCKNLFERSKRTHVSGAVLHAADTPAYFAALETERTITAHDARTDARTREFADGYLVPHGITSMLDAPILVDGRIVGVVCLEHVGPQRHWTEHEELLVGTFADFVALALAAAERAQHRAELERLVAERTEELRYSEEAFRGIFSAAPVALILTSVKDSRVITANPHAAEMFGVTSTEGQHAPDFWDSKEDRDELVKRVMRDGSVDDFEARLRTADGRSIWAIIAARTVVVHGERALLFGARDISRRRAMEEQLRELATTDELTSTLNRRRLFEVTTQEIERATRYERALSIAMFDLDHFKLINDRFGHLAGDETLRSVARTLRAVLRRHDHIGRYGGEEILIVFPETGRDDAFQVCERARAHVEALLIANGIRVTISGGVVQWKNGEGLAGLIARADAALYEAKSRGRNRIVAQ